MIFIALFNLVSDLCLRLDAFFRYTWEYKILQSFLHLRFRLMIWRIGFCLNSSSISAEDRDKLLFAIDKGEECLRKHNSIFAKRE